MIRRVFIAVLLVGALGAALAAALTLIRAQTGLEGGKELLAHELWPQARQRLSAYLWLHPADPEARFLMAEALARDEMLPAASAAAEAIQMLQAVPDNSSFGPAARLQQGRLAFLALHQPGRAERYLRRGIELGADLPAYQLLWTLLCMTGRVEQSESVFWEVYERSPPNEQPLRLREWYLSQFFPLSAHETLDRLMGVLGPDEMSSRTTESRRYLRFREAEPDSPVGHAAIANWCQQEGDPDFGIKVLEAAAKAIPSASTDPFFLSVLIATQLDLGRFDEAQSSFERWPADNRGHAYWKWRAAILDEVRRDHEAALVAYERAFKLFPGPTDWRLHHQFAGCLARLKRTSEASAAQERATRLSGQMNAQVHDRIRKCLATLSDPEKLTEVAQYYRGLGLVREAEAWEKHIRRLSSVAGLPERTQVVP